LIVLFLDIDGVVNCKTTIERVNGVVGIELSKMEIVKQIVAQTRCKVVLSSSWRLYKPDLEHVGRYLKLYDVTPDLHGKTDRGCEINAWLDKHPKVTNYAILDDNSDFHKDQRLFKTSWETGITKEVADAVIKHLQKTT